MVVLLALALAAPAATPRPALTLTGIATTHEQLNALFADRILMLGDGLSCKLDNVNRPREIGGGEVHCSGETATGHWSTFISGINASAGIQLDLFDGKAPKVRLELGIDSYNAKNLVGPLDLTRADGENYKGHVVLDLDQSKSEALGFEGPGWSILTYTSVRLVAGSKDRALYEKIANNEWSPEYFALFDGGEAKTPRTTSEVWFVAGAEKKAWRVADLIAADLGPMVPKEWRWPGAGSVVVVVGNKAATKPVEQVILMDQTCTDQVEPCATAEAKALKKALQAAGMTVRRIEGRYDIHERSSCSDPKSAALFFRPGMKKEAEALRAAHLASFVQPGDLKERPPRTGHCAPPDADVVIVLGTDARPKK